MPGRGIAELRVAAISAPARVRLAAVADHEVVGRPGHDRQHNALVRPSPATAPAALGVLASPARQRPRPPTTSSITRVTPAGAVHVPLARYSRNPPVGAASNGAPVVAAPVCRGRGLRPRWAVRSTGSCRSSEPGRAGGARQGPAGPGGPGGPLRPAGPRSPAEGLGVPAAPGGPGGPGGPGRPCGSQRDLELRLMTRRRVLLAVELDGDAGHVRHQHETVVLERPVEPLLDELGHVHEQEVIPVLRRDGDAHQLVPAPAGGVGRRERALAPPAAHGVDVEQSRRGSPWQPTAGARRGRRRQPRVPEAGSSGRTARRPERRPVPGPEPAASAPSRSSPSGRTGTRARRRSSAPARRPPARAARRRWPPRTAALP